MAWRADQALKRLPQIVARARVGGSFGAEVKVILSQIGEREAGFMRSALAENGVLCMPDNYFAKALDFLPVARVFGNHLLPVTLGGELLQLYVTPPGPRLSKRPSDHWHADLSYMTVPSKVTLLHSVDIPEVGGDTLFANVTAASHALPSAIRNRISGLQAIHSQSHTQTRLRAKSPDVVHPVLRTHPITGHQTLYVNPGYTRYWPVDAANHCHLNRERPQKNPGGLRRRKPGASPNTFCTLSSAKVLFFSQLEARRCGRLGQCSGLAQSDHVGSACF